MSSEKETPLPQCRGAGPSFIYSVLVLSAVICYTFFMALTHTNPLHNPDFPDYIVGHTGDRRNVIDHYKSWTDSAIRQDLQDRSIPLEVVAENFAYDFNIATVVRNANAFNARSVHIVGRKRWDKRGAVGTYNYTPVHHHEDPEVFYAGLRSRGFLIVAIDNVPGSHELQGFDWGSPRPLALIFGQESIGVSNISLAHADAVLRIEQYGSVRSLNVGVTSGIVIHQVASAWR